MREFTSGTRRSAEPKQPDIEFTLDGETYIARMPKPAVFAYLTAASARGATTADQIKAVLDFIEAVLEPDSRARFRSRLLDPEDELELEDGIDLLRYLQEEWSGRPTGSSTDSSDGRATTGPSSTDDVPVGVLIP